MASQLKKGILAVLAFLVMVPLIYVLMLSLGTHFRYPEIVPQGFTLVHYKNLVLNNSLFNLALINSMVIGASVVVISSSVGYLTARAFVRYLNVSYILVLTMISLPLFVPAMVLFLGVHQIVLKTPLVNTHIGVILCHSLLCIPYTATIFMNHLKGIPVELEQAAEVLGASTYNRYLKVLIPMLRPALSLSVVVSLLISGTEYLATFLVGGGSIITLPMVIFPYVSNNDYGLTASAGIIYLMTYGILFTAIGYISKTKMDTKLLYIE